MLFRTLFFNRNVPRMPVQKQNKIAVEPGVGLLHYTDMKVPSIADPSSKIRNFIGTVRAVSV